VSREQKIARDLVERLGGRENIASMECCMTRLRVDLRDQDKADLKTVRKVEGVKGVVQTGGQVQVILGPGLAQKVAEAAASATGVAVGDAPNVPGEAARLGSKDLLRKIANVFVPLIPGIIAVGMTIALNNVLQKANIITAETTVAGYSVVNILNLLGGTFLGLLSILVGQNAAREWGGPPVIGAVGAAILLGGGNGAALTALNMVPGRGGLIGALIAGAFLGWLYRRIQRVMPETVNIIVTPFLTLLIGGLIVVFVVQPVGGWLADGITAAATGLINVGGPVAGFLLAGTFLPLVMLGIHQGLTPIHMQLIETLGNTPLLPILAMAGAGQVGAALAVYFKTRDVDLKRIIIAALPVGFLGIGEPLIYGVTLPLFRPFIGACIGAGFGGAVIAMAKVGALAMGVSGILLALLVNNVAMYVLGLVVSYIAGFLATWLLGFDETRVSEAQSFTFGD